MDINNDFTTSLPFTVEDYTPEIIQKLQAMADFFQQQQGKSEE